MWWPWPWTCQFAKLGLWLDKRWQTDFQGFYPQGRCDVCRRRASWLTVGGYDPEYDDDPPEDDDYMGHHPVNTCGWCSLPSDAFPIESEADLAAAKEVARERSIAWRWRGKSE